MRRLIKMSDLTVVFWFYAASIAIVSGALYLYAWAPGAPETCYTGQVLEVHSADKLAERAGREVVSLEMVDGGLFQICWK